MGKERRDGPRKRAGTTSEEARAARLAERLKENLRRRKAQARGRGLGPARPIKNPEHEG